MVMIRGPAGTQLVVPEAQYNPEARASKYSIYCHSRNGPIEALLVRGEGKSASDGGAAATAGGAGPAQSEPSSLQTRLTVLEPPPVDLDYLVNLKDDASLNALYPPASGAAAAAIAQLPAAKRSRVGVD